MLGPPAAAVPLASSDGVAADPHDPVSDGRGNDGCGLAAMVSDAMAPDAAAMDGLIFGASGL